MTTNSTRVGYDQRMGRGDGERRVAAETGGTAAAAQATTTSAGTASGELFVIADCEGALHRVKLALREAGLVDSEDRWAAPRGTTLVQLGDATDRGQRSIALQLHLADLAEQAEHGGSRVELVVGNHEAMGAFSSVDTEATRMWGAGGLRAVVEEAERNGIIAPGSELEDLLSRCGGAWTIEDWRSDRGYTEFVTRFSEALYGGPDGPGHLESYVQRLVPFTRIGPLFFAHAGISRWVAEGAYASGGLEAFRDRLAAQLRDPGRRTEAVALRFFKDIGVMRGGGCRPFATSPCWIDTREWRDALCDRPTQEFLAEERLEVGFFGHTPSARPFAMTVNAEQKVGRVVGKGSPLKAVAVSAPVFGAFALDCGLGRDQRSRPHIYRWDERAHELEALAFGERLILD